jgi:hypothetical protein
MDLLVERSSSDVACALRYWALFNCEFAESRLEGVETDGGGRSRDVIGDNRNNKVARWVTGLWESIARAGTEPNPNTWHGITHVIAI